MLLFSKAELSAKDVFAQAGVDVGHMRAANMMHRTSQRECVQPGRLKEQGLVHRMSRVKVLRHCGQVGDKLLQVPVLLVDPEIELLVLTERL
jgi:hypothetical protein